MIRFCKSFARMIRQKRIGYRTDAGSGTEVGTGVAMGRHNGGSSTKLLILSDIHGNWPALEAVLRAEPDFEVVAFCGNVVGFGPCPVECIRWLRANVQHAVRGNHDNAFVSDQDCRCRGDFRELGCVTRAWHRTLLGEDERRFLRGLLTLDWFEWQGRNFRVAHATPYGDLFEDVPMDAWKDRVPELAEDFVLLGHSRVQGMRRFGSLTVVNPGSVGLARDSEGQACYAVFAHDRMTLKHTSYDVDQVVQLLSRAPLEDWILNGLVGLLKGSGATSIRGQDASSDLELPFGIEEFS